MLIQPVIGNGSIPMFKLDSLDLEPIDYMKIDCEGYEYNILVGAEQTIKKYKPIVVVEQKLHKDVGRTDKQSIPRYELLKSGALVNLLVLTTTLS
jgi:hypothetical protein